MLFISSSKFILILRYLKWCPDFFGHVRKRGDRKTKVNFKIYDVATRETNKYKTHISRRKSNKRMKFGI